MTLKDINGVVDTSCVHIFLDVGQKVRQGVFILWVFFQQQGRGQVISYEVKSLLGGLWLRYFAVFGEFAYSEFTKRFSSSLG